MPGWDFWITFALLALGAAALMAHGVPCCGIEPGLQGPAGGLASLVLCAQCRRAFMGARARAGSCASGRHAARTLPLAADWAST